MPSKCFHTSGLSSEGTPCAQRTAKFSLWLWSLASLALIFLQCRYSDKNSLFFFTVLSFALESDFDDFALNKEASFPMIFSPPEEIDSIAPLLSLEYRL